MHSSARRPREPYAGWGVGRVNVLSRFSDGENAQIVHPTIIEDDPVARVSWESRSMAAAAQTALLAVTVQNQDVSGQLEGF